MIYRIYPHAKTATVVSCFAAVVSALAATSAFIIGILLILAKVIPDKLKFLKKLHLSVDSRWIKIEIILIAAVFVFMLISKILGKKIAEFTIRRKVRKSVKFAYNYCCENPYYYDYAASLNRDFKLRYVRDRNFNIVERGRYR